MDWFFWMKLLSGHAWTLFSVGYLLGVATTAILSSGFDRD